MNLGCHKPDLIWQPVSDRRCARQAEIGQLQPYWVAAVRLVFGALLILVATESRMPRPLRVIGVLIVVAGLLTPLFGTERFLEAFTWFSAQGALLVRAVAVLPLVVGLFFVYAINSHRHVAA